MPRKILFQGVETAKLNWEASLDVTSSTGHEMLTR